MPSRPQPESRLLRFLCMTMLSGGVFTAATHAQHNLDFESSLPQTGTPVGWRVTGSTTTVDVDGVIAATGAQSLHVRREEDVGFGRIAQEIAVDPSNGDRARVRARIRPGDGTRGIALWIRVEGKAGLLYVDALPAVTATAWTRYEIEAPLAAGAQRLSFGVELRGRGDAWVDDFAVEIFDASTLPPPSPEASRYIERALAIVEASSVYRRRIDWPQFYRAVFEQARGAETVSEAHLAVRFAMSELNDNHSYFMAPRQMEAIAARPVANARTGRERIAPRASVLDGSIGYLMLPGFAGGAHADQVQFAGELQGLIAELDALSVCGFVVDLRENSGGNLWPMLTGLGPLLGDGDIAAAVDPDGGRTVLWYRDGRAGLGEHVQLRVRGSPYRLRDDAAPVAVLTSRSTASAAEIIAVAFTARPATRRFGAATSGAVTGTRIFPLADGAALVLAVAQTSDRHGQVYTGPLEPDERVDASSRDLELAVQPVVRAAVEWLAVTPACRTNNPSGAASAR